MSSAAIPGAAGLPVPSIEQLPVHFSVAARRHPLLFPERLCKIKRIGVSGIFRNFIDLQIRILQQSAGVLNTQSGIILMRRDTERLLKNMIEPADTDMQHFGVFSRVIFFRKRMGHRIGNVLHQPRIRSLGPHVR